MSSVVSSTIKFGTVQINPNYVFFNRSGVFAMVVHNPIAKGRKINLATNLFAIDRHSAMSQESSCKV